jgi:lysophospholipase L1-like esterase
MNSGVSGPIVCLGDSIAAAGWPAVLQTMLQDAGHPSVKCINAGVKGNTSGQGLRRLQKDVLSQHPAVVFIQFGFNDCNVVLNGPRPRTLPANFRENLVTLVERIRASGAMVVMIGNHNSLYRRTLPDGRTYEAASREYSGIVREVAEALKVALVDMRNEFPGDGIESEAGLAPDGIHLSQLGVEAYARIVADFLERHDLL